MKRRVTLSVLAGVLAVFTLAIGAVQGGADPGTDSNPVGSPVVVIPQKYQAPPRLTRAASVRGTPVYFTPQDENTSTTVLFLYNTNDEDQTVGLQTFYLDGSTTIDTTILVPAHGLVRICGDSVSSVSASWQDVILVNFTTFSTYAKLILPKGVKAEGYVAYDSSGVFDPLTEVQMLPLRFSVKQTTTP